MSKKISILISVYNWDVFPLIEHLIKEIDLNQITDIEIILIDDCSTEIGQKNKNREKISELYTPYVEYIELDHNVGRGSIRNLLAEKASGEYLLFLDCDVLPDEDNFILTYLHHIKNKKYDVLCGGISYKKSLSCSKEYDFYRFLSSKNDVKNAAERNIIPWRHMHTANILVRKSVFFEIPFNSQFVGYGYEDCEWGIRLQKNVKVLHIENTVSHLGLIKKKDVYERMCKSINNYLLLASLHPDYFRKTYISKVVQLFNCLSSGQLRFINKVIKENFFRYNNNAISYILFQFNKVILIAMVQRNSSLRQ